MTGMLLPAMLLALMLGTGGALLIHGVVETTHDRLLDGSMLAIAERLAVEDDEVTVDLPPVALGMLESKAQDSVYYSITYHAALVTGYVDLPQADLSSLSENEVLHWNATYRGHPIRVAARSRRVYGLPDLVLVQVAETTNARHLIEVQMLGGLLVLEAGLLGVVGVLTLWIVHHALAPLARLSHSIESRASPGAMSLQPLDTSAVPIETLAPVTAFNALLGRLEQSLLSVRRFTGDVSHQLRTPVAVLRINFDIMRRHGVDTSDGQSVMADIDLAVHRLERLITQLLTLARADDTGRGSDTPLEPVNLTSVAAEVLAERTPQAFATGLDVEFDHPDEPVMVLGDTMLIREICANLIGNAIHYNKPGGSVIVRLVARSGTPTLEVEDTGPGIPSSERSAVFERFYRGAQAHNSEGSGLGLSIVQALADRLGATVSLGDKFNKSPGLVVTVIFREC